MVLLGTVLTSQSVYLLVFVFAVFHKVILVKHNFGQEYFLTPLFCLDFLASSSSFQCSIASSSIKICQIFLELETSFICLQPMLLQLIMTLLY